MSTNSISVISLANFLSSIILFLSLQFVLYLYFDSIQYIFNLASIDLLQLLSSVSPILVFGCVFGLYEALSYGLLCSVIKNKFYFGTAFRSNLLGAIFSIGLEITLVNFFCQNASNTKSTVSSLEEHLQFLDLPYFGIYICFLSFFHYSEFLIIALVNPTEVKLESFMLNHSVPYHVAVVTSWLEYCLELYFLPGHKLAPVCVYIHIMGIILCVSGEFIRKLAIYTASTNFNHIVQLERREDHKLVTSGVYSVFRHPSYVGWYLYSVGTQLVLVNPLCIIGYALASWQFFNSRIYTEEEALVDFFGREYVAYQARVKIWIPFIRGYEAAPGMTAMGTRLTRRSS